jgi:hypothetical protein
MERRTKIDLEQLQVLWNCGMSDREIAKNLSKEQGIPISQTGVTRARQRLGLAPHFHHNANKKDDLRSPEEIYDESRLRANQWKKDNPERAAEQISQWQKDNREARNAYERARRNPDKPVEVKVEEKSEPVEVKPLKKIKRWFINVWRKVTWWKNSKELK